MKETQEQIIRKNFWNFCKGHSKVEVFVGGMYTGNFIGSIVRYDTYEVRFKVVKPITGDTKAGEEHTFPYGTYLTLRDLKDEEKQMDIAEVYGTIHV